MNLALHQRAFYLLATIVKKEQQSIVNSSLPESSQSVNFNLLHNIVRMRTQSHVCENPISSSVKSTSILVILVSHNAYHIHALYSFLWNNYACLSIWTMPLPCNSPPFFIETSTLTASILEVHSSTTIARLLFPLTSSVTLLINVWNSICSLHLFRNITLCESN